MDKNKMVSFLNWEGLQEDYEIINISLASEDFSISNIKVYRDDEYKIKGLMKGSNNIDIHDKLHGKGVPGSRMKPFVFTGTDKSQTIHYKLNHCYLGNVSNSYKIEDGYKQEFTADFSSFEIEKVYMHKDDEVFSLTEWYINGPNQNFFLVGLQKGVIPRNLFYLEMN